MKQYKYTLEISYQFVSFEPVYEKNKNKEFESDDLTELINILSQYINGFMSKKKNIGSWMYFNAEIRNNALISYDPEYTVCDVSLQRKD